jgi:hypothetical protein
MSAATIIAFPVQCACPVCHQPCSLADLSECYTCGDQYCRHCSECSCDRVAAELRDIMEEHKVSRPGRWEAVRFYVRSLRSRVTARLCRAV